MAYSTFRPTGSIVLDGVDLKALDVKQHRRRIGIVTQDPILFQGTILSNILYGCDTACREDAEEAARLANAWNFINTFPEKFETDGKFEACGFGLFNILHTKLSAKHSRGTWRSA